MDDDPEAEQYTTLQSSLSEAEVTTLPTVTLSKDTIDNSDDEVEDTEENDEESSTIILNTTTQDPLTE